MPRHPETMADRVKIACQARGFTQQKLAELSGRSLSAIQRLWQGYETSLDTLEAVAPHLQATVDYLRNGLPEKTSKGRS
jgi:transcriptional regulator with XRE-family HTH domain